MQTNLAAAKKPTTAEHETDFFEHLGQTWKYICTNQWYEHYSLMKTMYIY